VLAVELKLDEPFVGAEVEDQDGKGDPVVAAVLDCRGPGILKLGLFRS